jgi:hypothetical protein
MLLLCVPIALIIRCFSRLDPRANEPPAARSIEARPWAPHAAMTERRLGEHRSP